MKKMTKVISLALALVMCLALCACGSKTEDGDKAESIKVGFICLHEREPLLWASFRNTRRSAIWATTASTPALTWRSLRPPAICSAGTCRSLV